MNILLLNYNSTFRLKSKGPACLLKISPRKTILERQIQIINKIFINSNITIISGFKHKKIKSLIGIQKNISIIENENFDTTNCLYNVGLGITNINNSILIIPGNIVFKENFFKNFNKDKSQIWTTDEYQDIGCTINDGLIENIMWSLPNYWTNISYFAGNEFNLLKKISTKTNIEKLFLFEAINFIIEKGGQFLAKTKNNKLKIINKISDVKL